MRIERDFISNIPSEDVHRRQTEPARLRVSTDSASTLANTTDLVCLSVKVQYVEPQAQAQSRAVSVEALKGAYEAGAIRPDAARLASTLLRWSYDPVSRGAA
jgi:hypothetical protein